MLKRLESPAPKPTPGRPRPRVIHELPGRLRVRIAWLRGARVDSNHIATLLERVEGVAEVRINTLARCTVVTHDGRAGIREAVLERIAGLDPATLPQTERVEDEPGHVFQMALAGVALGLVRAAPMGVRTAITLAAVAPTIGDGLKALVRRDLGVEMLDAAAVGIATAQGDHTAALSTHFLIHLGEFLENRTNRSSTALLKQLLHPLPGNAWVERDGEVVQVPSMEISPGETVVVGPGESIPVDGQVLSGTAQVNEASVTGESVPVAKEARARVLSGTVVEEGRLRIRAVLVGSDTTTVRIAQFIRSSLDAKSDVQRNAERAAKQRVMVTLGLGALTFALTRDFNRLASVFLVDYSCAVKLGAPVAIKSAMYKAAKRGILVKGGRAVENLATADTVVFDKTGTLTEGNLEVAEVKAVDGRDWNRERLLALVASIGEHSPHPVTEAVTTEARALHLRHVSHAEVDFVVAHGLISEVDGERVVIGSRHFLEEHEAIDIAAHAKVVDALEESGLILLYVAVSGRLVGVVALRDHLRTDAAATLARLRDGGIKRVVILTGDRRAKAEALAAQLGVEEVFAELRPEEKADIVTRLKDDGARIAFVGDGVNDAPALVNADVGIAMPKGADLARASADVVLMDDNLAAVAEVHDLARRTLALIQSNVRVSVGINSLLFLGAALGWTSPVVSSLLHNGTTLGTLGRALAGVRVEEDAATRREKRRTP